MIRTMIVVAAVIALAGVVSADSRTTTELRAAADKGDVEAQVALGDRYRFGDRVSQDDAKAARWYRLAADQGHAKAQFELGAMYYYGWGVSQDNAKAAQLYRLAAEQGNADAQLEIGLMYRYGEGVTKDYISAYAWLILAADRDEVARYAAREVEDLVSLLTTEQVTEAKRMARELRGQIEADSVELAEQAEKAATRAEESASQARLQDAGNDHILSAGLLCKDHIESLSNYAHRWTDGILGFKFSRFSWEDEDDSIVRYYGDKIQFQNAFGAWINYIYWCDYDTRNDGPVRVGIDRAGKLTD